MADTVSIDSAARQRAMQATDTVEYAPDEGDDRGERIGPYKLLQPLGVGGMGEVWMAEQAEPVKRRVAVKLVKPGMDSAMVLARFEAERQAVALMDHPNIAKVFDAGTTTTGRPYFVMELVQGVPLTAFCDDNHLTPRERLELFVPICQAVQHAHQKGVIHRDLKPTNVLVALYDGKPVPKVIDFGVAKALHQNLTERTMFTEVGSVVGTLEYMSPEQAELNNLDIDTRSDVYSLGVMLYELLTGSRPLDAKRSAGYGEMLRIIREEEPTKPSTKLSGSGDRLPEISARRRTEPGKLSRLIQGDLDWIVMKALEKDRSRRYETANGLALDILRYLTDEPVLAGPPGLRYRLRKFARRNRGPLAAAAVVLLALVGGTTLATLGMLEARRQEKRALAETAEKEAERVRAEDAAAAERTAKEAAQKRLAQTEVANDILDAIFRNLNPLADGRPTIALPALLGEQIDRASDRIEGEAVGDPAVVARLQLTLGHCQLGLGRAEKAIDLFVKARTTLAAQHGPDHTLTLAATNGLANGYRIAGKPALAQPLFRETLAAMDRRFGPDHPNTLIVARNLAAAYRAAGQLDAALPLLERAIRQPPTSSGSNNTSALIAMTDLGDGYRFAGKLDRALPLLEEAHRGLRTSLGPDHPHALTAANNLALGYQAAGRLDAALSLYEETLARKKAKLGPDHPDTLVGTNNLALGYRAAGKLDAARSLFEAALSRQKALLGPDHPDALTTLRNLIAACREADALDREESALRELAPLQSAATGADSLPYAGVLVGLGSNLLRQGKCPAAEPYLRDGLAIREAKASDAWTTFNTRSLLGGCLLGQGKYADAEPLLTSGYEGMRRRSGEISAEFQPRLPEAAGRLVQFYAANGQPAAAAKWLDELWAWAETPPAAK